MSRDLKILAVAMFTWGVGEGMFFIFQPLYIQQLGADPILIGTILGINGLVMTLVQIPSGYLADRIGRRPMLRFSWIAGVIATWVMALAPTLGFFVAGLLLYGVTSSVMAPLNTYIQGARGRWSVGKAVSFVSAFYNLGGIIGPILGGFLGEIYNLNMVYYGAGAIFTLSTMIVFFARKQPVQALPQQDGEVALHRNKSFVGMLIVLFLVMLAVTLPQPLASNFLKNQRGLSITQIGQLGSLAALGSVVLMLVFGHLPPVTALMIGQGGLMIFALLLWQGSGWMAFGLAHFFVGGYRLSRAMTVALARPLVREHQVGFAFGWVESLNSLALMIAPVAAGFLYDWKPISIFPISLVVLALTLLLSIRFFSRNRHRETDFS
jgi:MFS family permease